MRWFRALENMTKYVYVQYIRIASKVMDIIGEGKIYLCGTLGFVGISQWIKK